MKRILVIDDDQDQRLLCRTILESAGYAVCDVEDGESGLQAFRQQPLRPRDYRHFHAGQKRF